MYELSERRSFDLEITTGLARIKAFYFVYPEKKGKALFSANTQVFSIQLCIDYMCKFQVRKTGRAICGLN